MASPKCLLGFRLGKSIQSQEAFDSQELQRLPPGVTAPAGSLTPGLRIFSWFLIAVRVCLACVLSSLQPSEGEVRHPPRPSSSSVSLGRNMHMGDLLEVISQSSDGPPSEHSHPFIDAVSFFFLLSYVLLNQVFFLLAPISHVYSHSAFCS